MYIVGTSGHIDHGKTSLIMALTGIDCDRLPEEKARAMTIDIGFASIEFPKFGTVSVIDVPGHERFIRNMVVGAWGVDLALLVIAADDGWMPQTEDHFGVLELLGIEKIIPVINKIDMVDAETVEIVEQEIEERLASTPYAGSLPVKVSAKTLEGIAVLKERILAELRQLPKISDAKKPYLFVDRVFASKGYGTVVTGTLKNGAFHETDPVKILPGENEARIKRIESHFSERKEGNPSQRTALNLSGINSDQLSRGHIVYKGNFFTGSKDIIASVQVRLNKKLKNNSGIEVLIGTASIKGKLILFSETEQNPGEKFPVRIKFEEPWYFYPGQPFILTSPGGYRIIGGGRVLLPSVEKGMSNRRLKQILTLFTAYTKNEIARFIVTAKHFIKKDAFLSMFPDPEKSIEKLTAELIESKQITELGAFLIDSDFYSALSVSIHETVASASGLNMKELSDKVKSDPEIVRLALTEISREHPVIEKEGRFFSGNAVTEDALNDEKRAILKMALFSGADGFEIDKISDEKQKREAGDLIKLGFLISLDGSIIYHKKIYDDMKSKVLALFTTLPKITVPEAKDATGLSRKYILPLLNRMEKDALIKRLGDFRIKS
jgi:selenocysteine-specific elongation factor